MVQSRPPELATTATTRPFLKWAGGKTQLLAQFAVHYPRELSEGKITRYVEPFLGGGAVFLDVAQRFSVSRAILFDINAELILAYKVVQRRPQQLIELLREHQEAYTLRSESERKDYFYQIRDAYNTQRSLVNHSQFSDLWAARAAYMIFLNKTCFNGLFRVNSKGKFNVPFGRYKRPSILDEENILRVSDLLQVAELHVGTFQSCGRYVDTTTFVYFDPPYRPISPTSSFTSYSKDKFDDTDQIALAQFFAQLDSSVKPKLMLSNSDPTNLDPDDHFFDSLYAPYQIHKVYANRMINSNAVKHAARLRSCSSPTIDGLPCQRTILLGSGILMQPILSPRSAVLDTPTYLPRT